MKTKIPAGFEKEAAMMKGLNMKILLYLSKNYKIEPYPKITRKIKIDGEGSSFAFPMQGILKYHGMADWKYRTAFFPSVSACNDAAKTVTYVKFDEELKTDVAFVNQKKLEGNELERVKQTLDFIRSIRGSKTKAFVYSRNILKASTSGKGLGTSAAGSAALALASIDAAFGAELSSNRRFVTTVARFLSGSGCRSAAGGVALWLSYPGIEHEDSFAIRLDNKNQFNNMDLITVPINSRINLKTEMAHKDAPNSPFFRSWMRIREKHIWELFSAVKRKDWKKIGELAELDTTLLHGTTMSGGLQKLIGWEPETIQLIRATNEMRSAGIPVYYSIDTGPTTVFLTHEKYSEEIINKIKSLGFKDVVRGKIGGPAELMQKKNLERELEINIDDLMAQFK